MERETARLNRTIDDLLRLSRLDQNRVELALVPVDLNLVATYLVRDRLSQAEQKGLTLVFSGEAGLPLLIADQGLLEQVISILLTNAIKYTPSGGRIRVYTQMKQDDTGIWIGFGVSDTRLGIAPDELSHLFERFFQGRANQLAGGGGTGLGLPIAKKIIDRHQGWLDVESTDVPGAGTTFTVWLPLKEDSDKHPSRGADVIARLLPHITTQTIFV